MPFLSIIVPIYNQEKHLNVCIDSILKQTFKDYELILVDDGSSDSSLEICRNYAETHTNIQIISKNNGGLVSARKTGVETAKGKYIGFVDSDDYIAEEMYEKLCKEADTQNADIVICDIIQWNGDCKCAKIEQGIEGGVYESSQLNAQIYTKMLYMGTFYQFGILPAMCNKIYRSDIIRRNQKKVDDMITIGEDVACSYFCLLESDKISYLKGAYLYYYRTNYNSMCRTWSYSKIDNLCLLLEFLRQRFNEFQYSGIERQYYYYCTLMCSDIVFECLRHSDKSYLNTIAILKKKLKAIQCVMPLNEFNKLILPRERKEILLGVIYGKNINLIMYKLFDLKVNMKKKIYHIFADKERLSHEN